MTTPQPPSITFTIRAASSPPQYSVNDVVYMAGLLGSGAVGSGVSDPITSFDAIDDFAGDDGVLRDAARAVLSQASPTLVLSEVAAAGGNPTIAEVQTALTAMRQATIAPTVLAAPGLTAGSAANARSGVETGANGVATALKTLAAEFEAVAVGDAATHATTKATALVNAGLWAGNNSDGNLMSVFNQIDDNPASGYWIGGALRRAGEFGRQRGINHAPVLAGTVTEWDLSYSPRAGVATDVSSLVGNFVSALLRRRGTLEIVGDQLRGVGDIRKFWSVKRVIAYLLQILHTEALNWISVGGTPGNHLRIANALERAGRVQVTNGELSDLTVRPDDELNDSASAAAGAAYFKADVLTIVPISQITVNIELFT